MPNDAFVCPNKSCTIGQSAFQIPLPGECKCGSRRIKVAVIHLLYEDEEGVVPGSLLAGDKWMAHPKRRWEFCCEWAKHSAKSNNLPKHYTTHLGAATCPDCLEAHRELDQKKLQKYRDYCER